MGNYRFRLSDMMPNAWFYKLRDMSRRRTHHNNSSSTTTNHPLLTVKKKQQPFTAAPPQNQTRISRPRNSYYFPSESIQPEKFNNSPINPKASDTFFPDPPRRSSSVTTRRRTKRRTIRSSSMLLTSSVSSGCNCRATLNSVWTPPDSSPENSSSISPPESSTDPDSQVVPPPDPFDSLGSWSSSCSCTVSSSATDIIIDMDQKKSPSRKLDKFDGFDSISKLQLRPILTKPANFSDMVCDQKKKNSKNSDHQPSKFRRSSAKLEEKTANAAHGSLSVKIVREERVKTVREQKPIPLPVRRSLASSSPGVKLRANSPRIASKKIQAYNRKVSASATSSRPRRKSISDSFAIVKSSFDPQRDFRESMVDMIVENNLRASKDLEELLACYLSLNSNEYHDIIVKVFERIWFDLTYNRL